MNDRYKQNNNNIFPNLIAERHLFSSVSAVYSSHLLYMENQWNRKAVCITLSKHHNNIIESLPAFDLIKYVLVVDHFLYNPLFKQ